MDRSYGRGAARRIFWQGILDRSYEGFIRFFVATLCCRRQLPGGARWQMIAWLALALAPLSLDITGARDCSTVHVSTGFTVVPFLGSIFGPQL